MNIYKPHRVFISLKAILITNWWFQMLNSLLIVLAYAFLGGGLKYIDMAYDEDAFSKFFAKLLAVLAAFVMAFLMVFDTPFSTVFFAGMILGVLIANKVDNRAFMIGEISVILFVTILSQFYPIQFALIPFTLFLIATIIDELGDEIAHTIIRSKILRDILKYRPLSDIALIGLIVSGFFSWFYLIPYYAFTFTYIAVKRLTLKKINNVGKSLN
jgi:hypothetical protein